jgi:hypothetical protein
MMFSNLVSRASALFLGAAGLALLFGSDSILPSLVAGFPAGGELIGQVLAGALLGLAALNWLSKSALIGGIYSRPVVSANVLFFFVAAMSLIKPLLRGDASPTLWIAAIPIVAFAAVYFWLLFRGPYESDLERFKTTRES